MDWMKSPSRDAQPISMKVQSLVEQRLLGVGYITIAEHYISIACNVIWNGAAMVIISSAFAF